MEDAGLAQFLRIFRLVNLLRLRLGLKVGFRFRFMSRLGFLRLANLFCLRFRLGILKLKIHMIAICVANFTIKRILYIKQKAHKNRSNNV